MNIKEIILEPLVATWVLFFLYTLSGVAAVIVYWSIQRRLPRPKAVTISLLRLLSFTILISFFLNPLILKKIETKILPSLAILVDTSPSMGLPGKGERGTRLEEAKALLLGGETPLLPSLSSKFNVQLYELGESLRPLKEEELSQLQSGRKKGDLTLGLKKLEGKISSAILLSDGNLKWEGSHSPLIPLFTVPIGEPEEYKDILIKEVKAPHLIFRGKEVTIEVVIKSYGYKGLTIPVILKEGEKILGVKEVHLQESPTEIPLTLTFISERVGYHSLSISIPDQVGEKISANNHVDFAINVVRDKIRILMISGSPSLNYRFMRMALKSDPTIDLLSFVILRSPADIINVPIKEQSLIPFPVDTLFSRELHHFDLLILDNLPLHLYIKPIYYAKIKEFISEGGSLAMIGGPYLLDGGRIQGTPLEEVLPIKMNGREEYHRGEPFTVKLGIMGKNHALTQLSPDDSENERIWQEMPALEGMNLLQAKSSKNVLLEAANTSYPILLVDHYGKGRTLILATDLSWKWYMGMVSQGKAHWLYPRFIERMVRWLIRDVSLDPVQISLPKTLPEAGQELEFRIKVPKDSLFSHFQRNPSISIFDPEGIKIEAQLRIEESTGEYLGSFIAKRQGIYKIKMETPEGNREEFVTIPGLFHEVDGFPDHKKLRNISARTGGKDYQRGEDLLKEIMNLSSQGERRLVKEERLSLRSQPLGIIVLIVFLSTEWYLRRKWGLI